MRSARGSPEKRRRSCRTGLSGLDRARILIINRSVVTPLSWSSNRLSTVRERCQNSDVLARSHGSGTNSGTKRHLAHPSTHELRISCPVFAGLEQAVSSP